MDLFQKCKDYTIAKEAMEAGIYPYFHALDTRQDTEVVMDGTHVIMLGSNNYLGLTINDRIIEAGKQAIDTYGSGCSGSRFLNGTLKQHIKLEKDIAEFVHKEAALTFSTGFQSNLAIISCIAGRNDVIIGDKENHASIYDACRLSYAKLLRYEHNDMEDLERQLQSVPEGKGKLIVTDGVFSMGGDLCNLPEIVRLAKKYDARIMIDDAHGFGVFGEGGRGTASHFGLEDEVDIIMSTFSKSLASLGGFMAASAEVCHFVQHNSRPFIFAASLPPANVACAQAALDVIKEEPQRPKRVLEIAEYARQKYKEKGIDIRDSVAPIIPINTYDDKLTFKICMELFDAGVYVNPVVAPAAPAGEAMIRTSYMATLTEEQIDRAADIIAEVMARHNLLKK